jgi:molybdopterin synthase catalytic subunit
MPVKIQQQDFDPATALHQLAMQRSDTGALVNFVGLVRDVNLNDTVRTLTLQHYPGMTERIIEELIAQAKQRWDIFDALVIHRVGCLKPQDRIVMVAVTGAHRGAAFQACEFLIDHLKTQAPFWKKEQTGDTSRWLDTRQSDLDAVAQWHE